MLIPIERLIDGCMQTLREDVLPDVESRFARGRVYAVLDVLHNLRDRVEEKAALFEAECESAETALAGVARSLGAQDEATGAIERALAEAPEAPPSERATALRAALVSALEALPEEPPEAARQALAAHLGPQAVRDVALLKPTLLEEVSKG